MKKNTIKNEWQLAIFVDENWKALTKLSEKAKHYEQEFPDKILELIDSLKLNYNKFVDAWTDLHA